MLGTWSPEARVFVEIICSSGLLVFNRHLLEEVCSGICWDRACLASEIFQKNKTVACFPKKVDKINSKS